MKLVWITHRVSDIRNGQFGQLQQFSGLGHAVRDQKRLWRFSCSLMKYFPEIASVQAAGGGDILHGYVILEILFDKGKSFLNIEIAKTVSLVDLCGGGGTDKAVNKQIEVSDQMKGRFLFMIYDIQHFIFHIFT